MIKAKYTGTLQGEQYVNKTVYVKPEDWNDSLETIFIRNKWGAWLRYQHTRKGGKTIGTPASSGEAISVLKKDLEIIK